MRYFIVFLLLYTCLFSSFAQNTVKLTRGSVPLSRVFEPDSLKKAENIIVKVSAAFPLPAGIDPRIKYLADSRRMAASGNTSSGSAKRSALAPTVVSGFVGALNEGTPNDNNMAINNDSFVISVLNSNIRVYNTNGLFKKNWGLEFFPRDINATKPGKGVGTLDRSYDPKVVFDPVSQRFIIVYLEGSESTDTRIIVAYSKTSNPLNGWNVYQLNGNPFGGKFWTDYPMIAINGEDLFITVNILKDNTDWKVGFTQSVIWQLPKSDGYNGDTLRYNLWSNILRDGRPIWNICPVQDAFQPGKEGLYSLSVEPGDAGNDTVYLHSINHNYSHGNPQYSYKVLRTDKPYGVPPYAMQKVAGYRLQTNDARVLGAFYVNNKIQYVQTSSNTVNGHSSVYHGIVQFPDNPLPEVKGNLIYYDSLDIAYPTIACAGNEVFGRQSLITFSHSSETVFPGTSVVYFDNNGEYSDLVIVRKGDGIINSFIPDTAERWGDYTSIQRRYNNPNEFWISGSYGKSTNAVGTWIGKISVNDPSVGIAQQNNTDHSLYAYPNPVADQLCIPFNLNAGGKITISIYDMNGRLVLSFSSIQESGLQKAFINTSGLGAGIYRYTVSGGSKLLAMEISVNSDPSAEPKDYLINQENFDLETIRKGSVLIFDKPKGWSSFKLVKKVKYFTGAARVGHAGTLDPLATGLMVICTGKCTKIIEKIQAMDKTYTGVFKFGKTTPSFDLETEFDAEYEYGHISRSDIESTVLSMTGTIIQTPPVYSAIKINGTRAYKFARMGETVEIKSRPVSIHAFTIEGELPDLKFEVRCSKGTYIRTLAHDFAAALQSGCYLDDLRRTAIGDFKIENAFEIGKFQEICGF